MTTIGDVKQDLKEKYVYRGPDHFNSVAKQIYSRYRSFLADDCSGCYKMAFQWAEQEKLVERKPKSQSPQLELMLNYSTTPKIAVAR